MKEDNLESELEFQKWLNKHSIPYWYIQQDLKTFSQAFKKFLTKRPDFFILIPNFGFMIIDVKEKQLANKYEKFFIDAYEVEKYLNLQRIFNMQCWFVISNESYHFRTWFWIPIAKIVNSGFVFTPKSHEDRRCYSVPLSEFIQVSDSDSLERVFSRLLKT